MISSFNISSFRCLEQFQLDELKRANVFYGYNGAGKTTVLKSFMFYFAKQHVQQFANLHYWGEPSQIFSFHESKNIDIETIHENGLKDAVHHTISLEDEKLNWSVNGQKMSDISLDLPFSFYNPIESYSMDQAIEHLRIVEENGYKENLLSILRTIESNLQDVYLQDGMLVTKINEMELPFNLSGTGFQRTFKLFSILFEKENTPYFLEVPNQGFHPGLLRVVFRSLHQFSKRCDRQLFFTCLSEEILDHYLSAFQEDLSIYYLKKGKVNHIKKRFI